MDNFKKTIDEGIKYRNKKNARSFLLDYQKAIRIHKKEIIKVFGGDRYIELQEYIKKKYLETFCKDGSIS